MGVQDVADGVIGATSQQYPLLMASLGVEAIAQFAEDGTLPANTEGKDFLDTGVGLIAAEPVDGVDSLSVEEGLELCWAAAGKATVTIATAVSVCFKVISFRRPTQFSSSTKHAQKSPRSFGRRGARFW